MSIKKLAFYWSVFVISLYLVSQVTALAYKRSYERDRVAYAMHNYCLAQADLSTSHDCFIDLFPECFDEEEGFISSDYCNQQLTGMEF